MSVWTCIYFPFALVVSLIAVVLFCLFVYVKLMVCGVLWILRRLFG